MHAPRERAQLPFRAGRFPKRGPRDLSQKAFAGHVYDGQLFSKVPSLFGQLHTASGE